MRNIDKKEDEKDYFKIVFRTFPFFLENIKKSVIFDFNLENEYTRNAKANAQSLNDFDMKIQVKLLIAYNNIYNLLYFSLFKLNSIKITLIGSIEYNKQRFGEILEFSGRCRNKK